jgi:hypothetical protein
VYAMWRRPRGAKTLLVALIFSSEQCRIDAYASNLSWKRYAFIRLRHGVTWTARCRFQRPCDGDGGTLVSA